MRVYIGYDSREVAAYEVAKATAEAQGCEVIPVKEDVLRAAGMLTRQVDRRGRMYDFVSGAEQATEFAISRFFVPILAQDGWVLFADCDVVFMDDPHKLLHFSDSSKALMVVKHPSLPGTGDKMDGQAQVPYPRKNWSSVMLINASHPSHKLLNTTALNCLPGRDLHAFSWLDDSEIGELPERWNWLVGVRPKPPSPAIAHFTLGGPWIEGWSKAEHDDIWLEARG